MKTELPEFSNKHVASAARGGAPATYREPAEDAQRRGRLRRLAPRVPVSIRALLHNGHTHQTTRIVDLSVGGVGLEGAMGIAQGDDIVIELLNKRTLSGKVMWWLAGRCGVAFHERLEPDDPLFRRQRLDIETADMVGKRPVL